MHKTILWAGGMPWLEVVGRHIVYASCMATVALMSDVSMVLLLCIWNVLWIKISITAALTNWQNILSEGADVWLPEQRWIASSVLEENEPLSQS